MSGTRSYKKACIRTLILNFLVVSFCYSQQPFFTDDADVTEKGKFHFELINEFDRLQRASLPDRYQNAVRSTLSFGLTRDLEISIGGQFFAIRSYDPEVATRGGFGDSTVSFKYSLLKEREHSRRPALAISGYLQLPTGSVRRGFGSGVYDYAVNGIVQKSFSKRYVGRLNGGIIFSGNTLTGDLGIKRNRGSVFTGGASLVRKMSDRLYLGGEFYAAVVSNFQINKGQLQGQVGGNYFLNSKTSLDFGVIAGHFSASPRVGFQVGLSRDF